MVSNTFIAINKTETDGICTGRRHKKPRIHIKGPRIINGTAYDGEVIINEDVQPNPLQTETEFGGPVTNNTVGQLTDHSAGDVFIY